MYNSTDILNVINNVRSVSELLGKQPEVVLHNCSSLNDTSLRGLSRELLSCREFVHKLSTSAPLFATKEYLWKWEDQLLDVERLMLFEKSERLDRTDLSLRIRVKNRQCYKDVAMLLRKRGINVNGHRPVYNVKNLNRHRYAAIKKAVKFLTKK